VRKRQENGHDGMRQGHSWAVLALRMLWGREHQKGSEQMNAGLMTISDDGASALDWRVVAPGQIWQAAHDPYLCTVVRSPDDQGGFYATIVRSGDLAIVVLEDAASLEDAQTWCEWRLGIGD
jgi:hypothetical protein